MKIVAICGAGIGSSGILKVNAERVLQRLGLTATVVAADIASVQRVAADAQVILTSQEFVEAIGPTRADVVVVENYFDTDELSRKIEAAIG
ncbi:PTS sugar transporter subunit IIB [Microcella sp.]|uniref:PTS sugar transporter subunit IIB n=1 Tax=Microcella sp. TaxID=1913979 RepID=UPI00391B0966